MEPAKLTKTAIDKMQYVGKETTTGWAHDIRWDSSLSGFGVRVHPSGKRCSSCAIGTPELGAC